MTQLRSLTQPGHRHVERLLDNGNRVTAIDDATIREYSVPIQDLTADLEGLRQELNEVTNDNEEFSTEIDVAAAEPIREYLDMSRHQAANDGLWHWLAVSEFPDFVYYRWRESGDITGKFLEGGTDIYSNAIHRLWWGAELTRDGTDYDRTERMFSQGELANDVLDRWFARYDPAAKVVVDTLSGEDSDIISDVTRDLRNRLSRYSLEMMRKDEIRTLTEDILADYAD